MKKILSLTLILILLCGTLISCDNAKSLLNGADRALEKAPYKMTMTMDFECDNELVNTALSAMNMEIPVTVDGKNIAMDMDMSMPGYTATAKVTVFDMVMYYDISVLGQNVKMKATLNEEQYEDFMDENNTEMMFDPEDFGTLTVETKGDKKYVACGELKQEGLDELNDMIKDALAGIGGAASVSNVSYDIVLNDGKYESAEMVCIYSVTADGETFNLTFRLTVDFSYDNVASIAAPANPDSYEEVDYDELAG